MAYGPDEWMRGRDDRRYPQRPWRFEFKDVGPGGWSVQNEVKTLFIGDVHLSDTPPGWRTDDYRDHILLKLESLMDIARAESVDLCLWAGDLFHSKTKVSYGLIADTIDILRMGHCLHAFVPGNHDVVNNDINDVLRRPLGLVHKALSESIVFGGAFGYTRYDLGPLCIQGVPYVHEMPYGRCGFYDDPDAPLKPHVWRLLAVHYGLTPTPMPYHTLVTDDPRYETFADVVFSGHIHDDLGVWKDHHGVLHFNLGSVSRGSLTEHNLERKPRVLLTTWNPKPMAPVFKAIEIPGVLPADQVFNLAAAEEKKEGEAIATAFLEQLGTTTVQAVSLESVKEQIAVMDVPDSVKRNAVAALEDAWE